jgi:Nuclease-related domain
VGVATVRHDRAVAPGAFEADRRRPFRDSSRRSRYSACRAELRPRGGRGFVNDVSTLKKMKLRYAGVCRRCHAQLGAGQVAVYDRTAKNVLCLTCSGDASPEPRRDAAVASTSTAVPPPSATSALPLNPPLPVPPAAVPDERTMPGVAIPGGTPAATAVRGTADQLTAGAPGASARREHERRKTKREQRIRAAHPRLGGIILALSDDPQSTRAWDVGARGEELLGKGLNALADRGVQTLHDRRIPRTKANIDHIAVAPTGVYVVDAKRYQGQRPALRVEGGLFRARTEKLVVGGRDRTKLVEGADKQVHLVREALARAGHPDVPVHGMLCFVDADWPLFGGSFTIGGHDVLWPKKAFSQLTQAGPMDAAAIAATVRALATHFPPA